jgi:hypothetical protein|tara:strand:- start:3031 stop:3945 length:915 start_codon:yes stop_codon:yes gene_type:complete
MSEANFSLIFRGNAVENGQIDVQDFAPALLAVGELLQSANEVVNGDKAKVAVKVRATAVACFEVDLTLWQEIIESIFTYAQAHKDEIEAANGLADLVFKIGGAAVGGVTVAGGGLFALLKWMKGRKPDRIEEKGGDVIVHIGDTYFITNSQTIKLAESANVRSHARKMVASLEKEGIESISARQPGGEELVLDKSDISSFDVPENEEEELEDETRKMTLQIISLSFKEDNKWRLTDGAEPFTADIEDIGFLNKIANDEISFGKNDYLICEVRERQTMTSKGLKKERTVVKVIEHKPAARQLRLM